jgi:hypothetical protein
MKITIELTDKELDLICRMSSSYIDVLEERIKFYKRCGFPCECKIEEHGEINKFWAKIEKAKNKMIASTK